MTATYKGNLTLGQCIPQALQASAELDASLAVQLPEIQAKIAGALEAQARATLSPPTISGQVKLLTDLAASIQASVAFPPPTVQLQAIAALVAELQATLGQLQASLSFSAGFSVALGTPGIHYYEFNGLADKFGNDMGGQLSGGLPGTNASDQVFGLTLLASDGGAIAAMKAVLG